LLGGVLKTVQLARPVPAPQPPYERKRNAAVYVGPVGWGGPVYGDTLDPFKWVDVCLVVGVPYDGSILKGGSD